MSREKYIQLECLSPIDGFKSLIPFRILSVLQLFLTAVCSNIGYFSVFRMNYLFLYTYDLTPWISQSIEIKVNWKLILWSRSSFCAFRL